MVTEVSRFSQVDGGNSSFCWGYCSGTFELDLEDKYPSDRGRPSRHREQLAKIGESLEWVLFLGPGPWWQETARSLPGDGAVGGATTDGECPRSMGARTRTRPGRGCPLVCVGQDGRERRGGIMSGLEHWVKEQRLNPDRDDS